MTKVLVIDDHPIVLQGCKQVLEDAGVESVTQAATLVEGFRLYRTNRPDVIVVDGISFIRRLRIHDKTTPILVFSMHADPVIVSRTLQVGATGYLLKDTWSDEFIKAFQKVREGQPYISHELASEVAFMEARGTASPLRALTLRELHTLSLIAEGKSYGSIADELHVSYKTVANTASLIKTKLGAKSLPELMRIAIAHLPTESGRRSL